jgi:hypothetical protein
MEQEERDKMCTEILRCYLNLQMWGEIPHSRALAQYYLGCLGQLMGDKAMALLHAEGAVVMGNSLGMRKVVNAGRELKAKIIGEGRCGADEAE